MTSRKPPDCSHKPSDGVSVGLVPCKGPVVNEYLFTYHPSTKMHYCMNIKAATA